LLKLARATLTYALDKWELPTPEQLDLEITPAMRRIAGVFVTLNKAGELRGCVGEIFPSRPLYRSVMRQAVNAGLNDRRFPRVDSSELTDIDIEISVLTPPSPVETADQIVIGRHGVVLNKSGRSAVYLPKVAVEQGWDRETMLTHLAQKAGLRGDGWREGASFDVFEATVFGEAHETMEPHE
jgi:AmmeMemoRadiSam system protein A